MRHAARLRFILDAHPSADWNIEQTIDGTVIQILYKGAHFRGEGITEDEAAQSVLEKLEQGPGLVDAAVHFST